MRQMPQLLYHTGPTPFFNQSSGEVLYLLKQFFKVANLGIFHNHTAI